MLNESRNWLKHVDDDKPDEQDLSLAPFYVLRALSKFGECYGRDEFTAPMATFVDDFERGLAEIGETIRAGLAEIRDGLACVYRAVEPGLQAINGSLSRPPAAP